MKAFIRAHTVRALETAAVVALAASLVPLAQARPVAAEIALVLDVSGSITGAAFASQRDGWVDALRSTSFNQALVDLSNAANHPDDPFGVAMGVYLFANNAVLELGWTWLAGPNQAYQFAQALHAVDLPSVTTPALGGGVLGTQTNLAEGLDRARAGLTSNAYEAGRRVIAISANGEQNTRRDGNASCGNTCEQQVRAARNEAAAWGVMVSAVALNMADQTLVDHMAEQVVTADGLTRQTWNAGPRQPFVDVLVHAVTLPADDPADLPEPGTLALAGLALLAAGMARARRGRQAAAGPPGRAAAVPEQGHMPP